MQTTRGLVRDTGSPSGSASSSSATTRLPELLGLALRRNPKRAHLLVSNVLGKHVPQSPGRRPRRTASRSAARVRELLGDDGGRAAPSSSATPRRPPGSATASPTASALAPYLHSTRRPVAGRRAGGRLRGGALARHLAPAAARRTRRCWPATARWSWSTTSSPPATPCSTRSAPCTSATRASGTSSSPWSTCARAADRGRLDEFAAELGARVDLVAAGRRARCACRTDVLAQGQAPGRRGTRPRGARRAAAAGRAAAHGAAAVPRRPRLARAACPTAAGTASRPAHRARLEAALPAMAARLADALPDDARRVLVLGFEELMYAPLRLARSPGAGAGGAEVRYSTTTRSPGARRRRPRLRDPQPPRLPRPRRPGRRPRRALRLQRRGRRLRRRRRRRRLRRRHPRAARPRRPAGPARRAHRRTSLLAVVPSYVPAPRPQPYPKRPSHAARAPARPRLLLLRRPTRSAGCSRTSPTSTLEAPTEEREEAIQSGGAHYAESLPVEYQPSDAVPGAVPRGAGRPPPPGSPTPSAPSPRLVLAERGPAPGAGLAGPGRHPRRRPDAPLGRSTGTASTCRTTPSRSCAAAASTPTRCAGWPPTTTRPTSSSSTAGPARARSPANWPTPSRSSSADGIAGFDPEIAVLADPGSLRAHVRHPRRLPHPVRLPQLHRLRA